MGRFFIRLDVSAFYSVNAPVVQILIDSVVVSSATVTAHTGVGFNTLEFTLDSAYLSAASVAQNQSNNVSVAAIDHLFGVTEPLAADLGTATITGTAAVETISGTSGNDIIDGLAGNDTIRGNVGDENDDLVYGGGFAFADVATLDGLGVSNINVEELVAKNLLVMS